MTDETLIDALTTAGNYAAEQGDDYIANQIGEYIFRLLRADEIKALGDLSAVKRAFDTAETQEYWFGFDFETTLPGFRTWMKAFYDAARQESPSQPLDVGDKALIVGPLNSAYGEFLRYFRVGEVVRVDRATDEDGDILISRLTDPDVYGYIDARSLTAVADTGPRTWTNPDDTPDDVTLIEDRGGDTWGRGERRESATYGNWPSTALFGPYTEVIS
ncbi:hypothetical protein [Nocardia arthritidis]|uniref:Uncharacterized protein n=1 Tax=Nocardia arthritidis TaxID=228602 RepID=A0A6G9YTC7_9NOCA|nr:hypothetical protein [Nocardia arthritidis]QIS16468.1 hypothetical protein F5544_43305 [Nocardia arthritidis]